MKFIQIKCSGEAYYDIEELIPFQKKLKQIQENKFKDLKESLIKDGLPLGFHVWKDNDKVHIMDGHHRQLALKALRAEGYFVDKVPCSYVIASSRKEAAKAILIANSKYANITDESLSDYMIEFDLKLDDIEFLDFPELNMTDLLTKDMPDVSDLDSPYTRKIETPIYQITGERPTIDMLFDKSISDKLIEEIEKSNLSDKEKEFLKIASYRHIKFNYKNIAEYYAHAEKEEQNLIENSALVIIDFNKAIERGFVKLTNDVKELYEQENE